MVTKNELKESLKSLGVCKGMTLEVHSSLSSFGELEGGAETVIDTLKELVTEEGSIFMPALRLNKELPLSEEDKKLGITVKIKVLPPDSDRTAMGIVADTFRKLPDTYTGSDTISISGWGKYGKEAVNSGLDYPIHNGGMAFMLGVDIYKLTAMHYGPVNWGHCGVSLGDGEVIHAWDIVRIDDYLAIENLTSLTGNHPKYLGWVALERVLSQKPRV